MLISLQTTVLVASILSVSVNVLYVFRHKYIARRAHDDASGTLNKDIEDVGRARVWNAKQHRPSPRSLSCSRPTEKCSRNAAEDAAGMKSFNEYTAEQERKRKRSAQTSATQAPSTQGSTSASGSGDPPLPSPPAVTQIVFEELLDQLIAARLVDGSDSTERDPDALAQRICQRITGVHQQILNDPNTPMNTRRVSYQVTGLAFMMLLLLHAEGRNW